MLTTLNTIQFRRQLIMKKQMKHNFSIQTISKFKTKPLNHKVRKNDRGTYVFKFIERHITTYMTTYLKMVIFSDSCSST
ncbi:hypothetical protein N665_0052s0015 [Sinapis alba]|nr:hypothetical protein N665_0052s0015 [Sinapis alba]